METNRAVVITGTSTGIGKACALYLDKMGYVVYAGVRNQADGENLKKEASARLTPVNLDVTDDTGRDPPAVGSARQDPAFAQVADDLEDEERVSVRLLRDPQDALGRDRFKQITVNQWGEAQRDKNDRGQQGSHFPADRKLFSKDRQQRLRHVKGRNSQNRRDEYDRQGVHELDTIPASLAILAVTGGCE